MEHNLQERLLHVGVYLVFSHCNKLYWMPVTGLLLCRGALHDVITQVALFINAQCITKARSAAFK